MADAIVMDFTRHSPASPICNAQRCDQTSVACGRGGGGGLHSPVLTQTPLML